MNQEQVLKTGTTTLGIVAKDGIVMAADKRATVGNQIIVSKIDKVIRVGERFVVTIAGTASEAVMLSRHISAELKLKELRSGNEVTVKEAANLLAQFVYNNIRQPSVIQGVTHFLFAGYDKTGTHLYDVFPDGSITEIDTYFSSGSGSVFAYGVLDSKYQKSMNVQEAAEIAKDAIRAAVKRDSASGNGYDIVKVTPEGVEDVANVMFTTTEE
jgi:proteasome beta subunit